MAEGRDKAVKEMVDGLVAENRRLQIQVLEERLIGLEAQEKLARVLYEQTEAELKQLQGDG